MRIRPHKVVYLLLTVTLLSALAPTLGQVIFRATNGDDGQTIVVSFECTDLDSSPPVCTPVVDGDPDSVWNDARFFADFKVRGVRRTTVRDRAVVDNPLSKGRGAECDFIGGVDRFALSANTRYSFSCLRYPRLLQRYSWSRTATGVGMIATLVAAVYLRRRSKIAGQTATLTATG